MFRTAIPVIHVTRSETAERYYCGALGFERRFAYRPNELSPDPCYMGLARGEAWLHVSSFPPALHRELTTAGVAIELAPTDQSWGNREMYLRDPDGNSIRLVRAD